MHELQRLSGRTVDGRIGRWTAQPTPLGHCDKRLASKAALTPLLGKLTQASHEHAVRPIL